MQSFRGDVCDRLACCGPILQQGRDAHVEERRVERKETAANAIRNAGLDESSVVLLTKVPYIRLELTELPSERLEEFRNNVKNSLSKAADGWSAADAAEKSLKLADDEESSESESESESDKSNCEQPSLHVLNACMTCGGYCCKAGGAHAFLDKDNIRRIWMTRPEDTPESVLQYYLDSLPPQSSVGWCVYHTDRGCNLDRTMRADICNDFHCSGIVDHKDQVVELTAKSTTAVAFDADGKVQQIATMTKEGERTVHFDRESAAGNKTIDKNQRGQETMLW
jgi:hypothetical protein